MKRVRVLEIARMDQRAGIENFLINVFRHIDKEKVQLDFLRTNREQGPFDKEIIENGGRIFYVPPISKNPCDIIRHFNGVKKFLKENKDIDVVHAHGNTAISLLDCRIAYNEGISHVVGHSHNNSAGSSKIKLEHHLISRMISPYLTDRFACSEDAWRWMFGNDYKRTSEIVVVKNGINTEKYKYNSITAKIYREKLGLSDDNFVIGTVGRLTNQKNHKLLIEAFAKVYNNNEKARLVLVGDGELRKELEEQCTKSGVEKAVIFAGFVDNVNDYLQAMDVFALSSLWEGFGICLIEAQAAGLPCIVSSAIVQEVIVIPKLVRVLSEGAGVNEWAAAIKQCNRNNNRDNNDKYVTGAGYDIVHTVKQLEQFYISCGNRKEV